MELLEQIRAFQPWNPQEEQDRAELLRNAPVPDQEAFLVPKTVE